MSENQLFENDLLERLREVAPRVPAEVLSPTGPSAQRVLGRVLATPRGGVAAGLTDDVPGPLASSTARRPRWFKPRPVGAVASLAAVLAAVTVVVVLAGGGASSIVARAYAATDPAGVIVHYVQISHSSLAASRVPATTEFWTYGQDSRELIDANEPPRWRQNIVSGGGQERTLAFGILSSEPASPANTRCAATLVLEGDCAMGQDNDPIDALRTLYRSGQIRATSQSTINGRRVDVLTGSSDNLRVRAVIDARSFLPINVTMTETFPQGHGASPVTDALTITGYQRLPVNARNRRLLALPAHPHVRVIRFRSCPTRTNPYRLCSSAPSRTPSSTSTATGSAPSQARFLSEADTVCRAAKAAGRAAIGSGGGPLGGARGAAAGSSTYFSEIAQRLDRLAPPANLTAAFTRLVDDDREVASLFTQTETAISEADLTAEDTAMAGVGKLFRDATATARKLGLPACGL